MQRYNPIEIDSPTLGDMKEDMKGDYLEYDDVKLLKSALLEAEAKGKPLKFIFEEFGL